MSLVTGFLTWRSQPPLCHGWPWKTFLCLSKFNFLFCKIGTRRTAPKLLIKQDTISKAPCPGGGGHSQRDATVISLVITANNRVFVSWSFWQSRGVGRRLFLSRWNLKSSKAGFFIYSGVYWVHQWIQQRQGERLKYLTPEMRLAVVYLQMYLALPLHKNLNWTIVYFYDKNGN